MTLKKILIIDDHQEFRKMLRVFIEKQIKEIEIIEASSGEEGVNVARRERPNIILVDIYLPQMNGMQTARKIKKDLSSTRVITMSTFKDQSDQEFVDPDIVAFIDKNELDHKLISLLNKLLSENFVKSIKV